MRILEEEPTRTSARHAEQNEPHPTEKIIGISGSLLCLQAGMCLVLAGCSDRVRQPTAEELARFEAADRPIGAIDMDRVMQAKLTTGPYLAVPGDVLRLEMPRVLELLPGEAGPDSRQIYNCRISDNGTIVLPIIGPLAVKGKSLAEIESAVAAAYYPKYVAIPFPVYVSVLEYQTQRVSIVGAVAQPGVYSLRHDRMSLVALLMQAGGIVGQGAAVIRVARAKPTGSSPLEVRAAASSEMQIASDDGWPGRGGLLAGSGPRGQDAALRNLSRKISPALGTPADIFAGATRLRAVFEPEGPLRTTGWLSVEEEGGDLSIRRWLDVGNEPQQSAFLGTVAAQSRWPGMEDLRGRLSQLAAYLDSNPQGYQTPRTTRIAGWQTTDGNRFVTAPYSSGDWRLPSRSIVADAAGNTNPVETLVLPIRGLNIPFADVALAEGDTITVEWPREQFVSVVGLVNRPGNMPYPSGARYTLIQAVAFAGGLDLTADPRYVSVYRLTPEGEIVSVTVQLVNPKRDQQLTETLALPLKPGDVVSVEHTLRTRTNVFLDRIFRISLGLYLTPEDLWNE